MSKARFEAPLVEGHKGIMVVLVPFDPEAIWGRKPVRLAGRRHGWLVQGTVNGKRFTGYIGERWGRFFISLDEAVRQAAGISDGDLVSCMVEPTATVKAYQVALAQSASTTQPGKARADALAPPRTQSAAVASRSTGRPKRRIPSSSSSSPKRHPRQALAAPRE